MRRRDTPPPLPRLTWMVGELEVTAPADWRESDVREAMRPPLPAVRARLKKTLMIPDARLATIDGHRWAGCAAAIWREDAPYPAFRWAPEKIHDQTIEVFMGRRFRRRTFPLGLTRMPGPLTRAMSAAFLRSDGERVWLGATFAPWWRLDLEQEDEEPEKGIIRVSVGGEAIAYFMPCRVPESREIVGSGNAAIRGRE